MGTTISAQPLEMSVRISDTSLLNDIKRAIKMIRGVESVRIKKASSSLNASKKHLSGLDEALLDVEEGRIIHYKNLEELIKDIEE